ncbi:MAG: hypothetical protein NW220_11975 [Leptolyngbyaceae cyanobacterium bins.349]|nr:hypothetical protein [Leptolyngbyaceae cyanobacterium bins.349]
MALVGIGQLSAIASLPQSDWKPQHSVESPDWLAQAPTPTSTPASAAPIALEEIPVADTALLFQNDRYAVRIYQEGAQAYVNVYDKVNQTQPLDRVPVAITPAGNPAKDPTKYIATVGDQQYIVVINPLGTSELTILKGGTVVYRQGSNQVAIARAIPQISSQAAPETQTQELMRTIFKNFAALTLFVLMFSMGLRWTFADVIWLWRRPSLLVRSLISVFVAVPLFGVLLGFMPGFTVAERLGVGAIMICPGAPTIPQKSLKAGGHEQFAASLQFTVCLLAIVSIPLTASLLSQFYPNQAWLSPQEIAHQIFLAQVLPMGVGVLLAQYLPKLAHDWQEPVGKIANLLLVLLAIALLVVSLHKVLAAGFLTYLAIAGMAIASLVCGHLLGGPDPNTRTDLAYATVTRNAGLAILLVTLNFPNLDFVKGGIISTLITYALITAIVSIPYTVWRKRSLVKS